MAQYTKKPVVVDALQWDGTSVDDMNAFMTSVTQEVDVRWTFTFDTDHSELDIRTLDGLSVPVPVDHWVVCDENNDFSSCDNRTFNATYTAV